MIISCITISFCPNPPVYRGPPHKRSVCPVPQCQILSPDLGRTRNGMGSIAVGGGGGILGDDEEFRELVSVGGGRKEYRVTLQIVFSKSTFCSLLLRRSAMF